MSEFIKGYVLRPATPTDIPAVLGLMRDMAAFGKLNNIFKASAESLHNSFFSGQPSAYCLVITPEDQPDTPISYIMWFYNYSSFLDRRGIYLEDLGYRPRSPKTRFGCRCLALSGSISRRARMRSPGVGSAGLEPERDRLLQIPRRSSAGRVAGRSRYRRCPTQSGPRYTHACQGIKGHYVHTTFHYQHPHGDYGTTDWETAAACPKPLP